MDTEQTELFLYLDQLKELTRRTIGHYEFNAESYRIGTADHDVSQNYAALLEIMDIMLLHTLQILPKILIAPLSTGVIVFKETVDHPAKMEQVPIFIK